MDAKPTVRPVTRDEVAALLLGFSRVLAEEGDALVRNDDERAGLHVAILNACVLDTLEALSGTDG